MPDGSTAICYAKSIAENLAQKTYAKGFDHVFFDPDELNAIASLQKPAGIFIDSMSDWLSVGVKQEWIEQVITTMHLNPRHVYFTLTKNFPRLERFKDVLPKSAWVGVSMPPTIMFEQDITRNHERWLTNALKSLSMVDVPIRWLSLEPLSWDCSSIVRDAAQNGVIQWAVIGAASRGRQYFQPGRDVFERTLDALVSNDIPVHMKGNLDRAMVNAIAGRWMADFPTEVQARMALL